MSVLASFEYFPLGAFIGLFVLTMAAQIVLRFRRALKEDLPAANRSSSGGALFVVMMLLHPQCWLLAALVGYGGYALFAYQLSAAAVSFFWGAAMGGPLLAAVVLLGQRRRKRLASAKGNASTHVA